MSEAFKKKTVGRDVISLLMDDTLIVGDGTLKIEKGHFFAKTKCADSGSVFGTGTKYENIKMRMVAEATEDLTLAVGDEAVDLGNPFEKNADDSWKRLLGYGRSKSVSKSKTTVDMTVDEDEYTDQQSDGLVSLSGSINGYKLNCPDDTSATAKLMSEFMGVVDQTSDDESEWSSKETTTPILTIAILYQKSINIGEKCEIEIIPCTFTSSEVSADYGSATSINFSWTGNAQSSNGVLPCTVMTKRLV